MSNLDNAAERIQLPFVRSRGLSILIAAFVLSHSTFVSGQSESEAVGQATSSHGRLASAFTLVNAGGSGFLFDPSLDPSHPSAHHQPHRREWTGSHCGTCHQVEQEFSHPIDIVPSMPIPEHLPLEEGRMTCVTCHDNTSSESHAVAREEHTGLLRGGDAGVQFCMQCHATDQSGRGTYHAMALQKAHLRPMTTSLSGESGSVGWSAQGRASSGSFDEQSSTCLGCHDGTAAAGDHSSGDPFNYGGGTGVDIGLSHPIGVRYPRTGRHWRQGAPMHPASSLDPRVSLGEGGTVSCTSCHNLYSPIDALLVMPNDGSALCLSCHDE